MIMYTKEQIEREIAELEAKLKTASPLEWNRLEASRRVWLGRLVNWKEGKYQPRPELQQEPNTEASGAHPEQPKQRKRARR